MNTQSSPKMRITEEDLELVRQHFSDERLLKVLRKFVLPVIEGDEPIGQLVDLWMTTPIREMSPEDAYHQFIARNFIIGHLESVLSQLSVIASQNIKKTEVKSNR